MRSFLHVVGTRPNLMKAAPVMRALAHRSASQRLLHTGQHYDPEMSAEIARELDLPRPDVQLEAGSASHARQTAAVLVGVEDALVQHAPDAVVVYGDVNSTLGAALAAAKLGIPVAHVEAGLRSGDRGMPEEVNRILVDHMSAWLFATDTVAADHLRREGLAPERVHVVGNVMADSLLRVLQGADASPSGAAVVTLHRPENVDDPDIFAGLVRAVAELARTMPVLFPVHPRTRERLASGPLPERLRDAGVRLVPPLGYAAATASTHIGQVVFVYDLILHLDGVVAESLRVRVRVRVFVC
jgi:UDP-N-acetylglucosamine 2-epimerase (non-hydrolysing)